MKANTIHLAMDVNKYCTVIPNEAALMHVDLQLMEVEPEQVQCLTQRQLKKLMGNNTPLCKRKSSQKIAMVIPLQRKRDSVSSAAPDSPESPTVSNNVIEIFDDDYHPSLDANLTPPLEKEGPLFEDELPELTPTTRYSNSARRRL